MFASGYNSNTNPPGSNVRMRLMNQQVMPKKSLTGRRLAYILGLVDRYCIIDFLSGTLTQGIIVLTTPTYAPKAWQSIFGVWAALFFAILVNTIIGGVLPTFEGFVLILHILGYFAPLLALIVYGPHKEASEVFGKFVNGGGWPTQSLSCMIGLAGSVFASVHVQFRMGLHCFIKLILHSCPKKFTMPLFSYQGPLWRIRFLMAAWGPDCY